MILLVSLGLGCWSESPLKNGATSGMIAFVMLGLIGGQLWGELSQAQQQELGLSGRLMFGLIEGLLFGVISGLGVGSLNRITLVETMSWKWNQFWQRTIPGSIVGLIGGLFLGLFLGLVAGPSWGLFQTEQPELRTRLIFGLIVGLIFGLILGPIGGLASGLVGGFADRVKVGKVVPNEGITLSRKNALAAFLVTWLTIGLIGGLLGGLLFGLVGGLSSGLLRGLIFGLSSGLCFGLVVGLNRGGSAVIKHYALRVTLWLNGYTPFKFIKFLDHCDRLIFLKKVGGGHMFIHRMLLEYFSELTPQSSKAEDGQKAKGVRTELGQDNTAAEHL
jgi:hypothetical protein